MAFTGRRVAVTETKAAIWPPLGSTKVFDQAVMLQNTGSNIVYLGGADVDAVETPGGKNFPLNPGQTIPADMGRTEVLYGVTGTGLTSAVAILAAVAQ